MVVLCFFAQFCEGATYIPVTQLKLTLTQAMPWIYLDLAIGSMFNTYYASTSAMAVDGTIPDSHDRFFRTMITTSMKTVAGVVAQLTNIYILSYRLEDYSPIWPIYICVVAFEMCLAYCCLMETKPTATKYKDMTACTALRNGCKEIHAAWEVCTSDAKLRIAVLALAVAQAGVATTLNVLPNFAFYVVGLQPATISAGGTLSFSVAIFAGFLSYGCARCIGNIKTYYLSQLLFVCSLFGLSTGTEQAYWLWGCIGLAIAFGMQIPPLSTVMTSRVAPENLGKFFAGSGLIVLLTQGVTVFAITNFWLNVEREQLKEVLPRRLVQAWYGSACTIALSAFIVFLGYGCSYEGAAAESDPKRGVVPSYKTGNSGSRIIDEYTIQQKRTASLLNLQTPGPVML